MLPSFASPELMRRRLEHFCSVQGSRGSRRAALMCPHPAALRDGHDRVLTPLPFPVGPLSPSALTQVLSPTLYSRIPKIKKLVAGGRRDPEMVSCKVAGRSSFPWEHKSYHEVSSAWPETVNK